MICILAEVERVPFDLPKEAELVEGWTTEYSGIRYMLLAAEYIRGFAGAAVYAGLFLGGWAGPPVPPSMVFEPVYLILIFGFS